MTNIPHKTRETQVQFLNPRRCKITWDRVREKEKGRERKRERKREREREGMRERMKEMSKPLNLGRNNCSSNPPPSSAFLLLVLQTDKHLALIFPEL